MFIPPEDVAALVRVHANEKRQRIITAAHALLGLLPAEAIVVTKWRRAGRVDQLELERVIQDYSTALAIAISPADIRDPFDLVA